MSITDFKCKQIADQRLNFQKCNAVSSAENEKSRARGYDLCIDAHACFISQAPWSIQAQPCGLLRYQNSCPLLPVGDVANLQGKDSLHVMSSLLNYATRHVG